MSEDTTEIRIYDILVSLLKHKFIILVFMIVGIAVGAVFAGAKFLKDSKNPVYTAKASMIFNSETHEGVFAVAGSEIPTQNDFMLSNYLIDTATYIARSQSVYYEVMEKLQDSMDYATYHQAVSVEQYEDTSILLLAVTNADKFQAVIMANEIVEVLPKLLQETLGLGSVTLIDKAETASKSEASINIMFILLGMAGGGMLAAGIIALLAILHPTFMDSAFIEEVLKEKVLAEIPHQKLYKGQSFQVSMLQKTGIYLQAFDLLSRKLISAAEKENQKSIMVTSAGAAEGKTSVAIHLAQALAARGCKVLLVDGDAKNPNIGVKYGIDAYRKNSLNAVARKEVPLEKAPIKAAKNLYILQCYETADTLFSEELKSSLSELKEQYDFILYDTSPSALIADAFHMKGVADAVLFVIRQGVTKVEEIQKIHVSYEQVGIPFAGCVLNAVRKGKVQDPYLNKYYQSYGTKQDKWQERTNEEALI
ncbi:MAG: hypothetical protein E7256_14440 [Lachnospiraceae bacterium]|nr:hypothetical protein [Lachnospiraceae bacterium]